MSTSARSGDGSFATVGPDVSDLDPFECIELESGEVLIYSTDDEDAWVQSDGHVDLEFML